MAKKVKEVEPIEVQEKVEESIVTPVVLYKYVEGQRVISTDFLDNGDVSVRTANGTSYRMSSQEFAKL